MQMLDRLSLGAAVWLALGAPAQAAPAGQGQPEDWVKASLAVCNRQHHIPQKQLDRLVSILHQWPSATTKRLAQQKGPKDAPPFPCDLVFAIKAANKAVHDHIQANPLENLFPDPLGRPAIDYAWDSDPSRPPDPKRSPGYQVDSKLRTMAAGAKETVRPTGGTKRRDCIGMQIIVVNALNGMTRKSGLEAHQLVIGNDSLGRFPAGAGAYALGLNPVDNGVHHVAGLWPQLKGADTGGGIPEYAIVLDYWPSQEATDPWNIWGVKQFVAQWASLDKEGALRSEE